MSDTITFLQAIESDDAKAGKVFVFKESRYQYRRVGDRIEYRASGARPWAVVDSMNEPCEWQSECLEVPAPENGGPVVSQCDCSICRAMNDYTIAEYKAKTQDGGAQP